MDKEFWAIIAVGVALGTLMLTSLSAMESRFDQMDSRIDSIDTRLDNIDRRLARVEGHMFGIEWEAEAGTPDGP